jgi:hypothetical protein
VASRSSERGRFFRIPSIFGGGNDDEPPAAFASASVSAYQATDGADSDAIRALTPRRRQNEGALPGVARAADVPIPPAAPTVRASVTASASAESGSDREEAKEKGFFGRTWQRATSVFD